MLKSPRTNALASGLIERTSSMLDEIALKIVHKDVKVIDKGKRSNTLSEVKPVGNIIKNQQIFRNKSLTKGSPSFT